MLMEHSDRFLFSGRQDRHIGVVVTNPIRLNAAFPERKARKPVAGVVGLNLDFGGGGDWEHMDLLLYIPSVKISDILDLC